MDDLADMDDVNIMNNMDTCEQFERTEALLGSEALTRLQRAHVVVFGVGGVGSHCVLALARAGVGQLTLIDGDAVAPSNINRQAIAFQSTIGMRKVDVAKAMIADINPACVVETRDCMVYAQDVEPLMETMERPIDYIVDAIDTVQTKVALAEYASKHGTPLIMCAGTAGKLDAQAFRFADIYQTTDCPLCRRLRSELRKAGVESLEVLYSTEKAYCSTAKTNGCPCEEGSEEQTGIAASHDTTGTVAGDGNVATTASGVLQTARPVLGTVSYVPSTAGLLLAGRVIEELIGRPKHA